MGRSASAPQGLDVQGMALDLDERARRLAPIYSQPDVAVCVQLLTRNPQVGPAVRRAIEAELAKLPGGGVQLSAPLRFGAGDRQAEPA